MRAFVVRTAGRAGVETVPDPVPSSDEVLIEVRRAGVCGTDVEFYTGEMQYLRDGQSRYPIRLGHEWMGVVEAIGDRVDPAWLGRRVTGDTMIGCGDCARCADGRHHVCADRFEVGIRGGMPGALAERLVFPAAYLHALPDSVDDASGALVEPAGNALRSVRAAGLVRGERVLILGTGTIGLLAAMFARADGDEVHLLGRSARSLAFARSLGFDHVWTEDTLPRLAWPAVIDASNASPLPAEAVRLVEPGKRVVYVGLAGSPSMLDTRALALADVTAVGILGGSQGLDGAIEAFATGSVDARPLVAAVVALEDLASVLAGRRPAGAGAGPKTQIVPTKGKHS
ncbi:zinc-dependent alcohol dehydrogenase [Rathayibacter sp. KR2-224]|uniref:zinc-dependent alcohol dehydrogenase n=1 Tax=Rathayibacter sp. KR2-224 TaxID=3400913 RepID=UPI003C0F3895